MAATIPPAAEDVRQTSEGVQTCARYRRIQRRGRPTLNIGGAERNSDEVGERK